MKNLFLLVAALCYSLNATAQVKSSEFSDLYAENRSMGQMESKSKKEFMMQGTQFYVGTYTNSQSEGIYAFSLYENGEIDRIGLVAKAENPSFLTKSADGKYVLAVNENKDGTVSSFEIHKDRLEFINKRSTGGAHPCFVSTNEQGFVLAANYTGGNVGLLQLMDNGELSPLLDVQQHAGQGSHIRQDAPHAHSVWFDPYDKTIISVDLGTNELLFSTIDPSTKKLVSFTQPKLELDPGAGPRHLSFHPAQPWIYVVNELNSTVSLIKKEDKTYVSKSSVTTLPEGYAKDNTCADIHISRDGRFLYASNRGHNSIAIFSIQSDGNLELVGHESTRGDGPRNFVLSPDNDFLLVANQHSDNIVSFKRDAIRGGLKYSSEVKAHTPVCILF